MPGPTSTTTPAPSWPKITGNRPSGSPPERVNSSVWQTPDALISTTPSPDFGPSRSPSSIPRFLPASKQTAAFVFTLVPLEIRGRSLEHRRGHSPCCAGHRAKLEFVRPQLGAVLTCKNPDVPGMNPIGNDIGRSDDNQFTGAEYAARTPSAWSLAEPMNCQCYGANHARGSNRIVGLDMSANRLKTTMGSSRPTNSSLHRRRLRFVYLAMVAETSASLAKSPRSASRSPASMSANCHASRAT